MADGSAQKSPEAAKAMGSEKNEESQELLIVSLELIVSAKFAGSVPELVPSKGCCLPFEDQC